MADPKAELSSVTTTLDELTKRVAAIAESSAARDDTDALAVELYEVERALQGAHRRLVRILDDRR